MQERRKRVRINYKDSEGSDVYSIIDDIPSDTSREHLTALKIHYSNGAIETASLDEKYEMLLLNSWEKNQFEYASDEQIKTLDKSIASIIMKIKYNLRTGPAVRVDGFMMSLLNF